MTHILRKHAYILLLSLSVLLLPAAPASSESYTASTVPWSGYWWPFTNGGLSTGKDYRGHPAPLEKYELLTLGKYPGKLVSFYNKNYYDTSAPKWYGLCAFWARAACYEAVDVFPSSENNIIFRVGDKKGLLTLAHDGDMLDIDQGRDPDAFHYWLLHFIKDQGVPFAADLDSGEEVWTYPIYAYDMKTTKNGNILSVDTRIYYSDDHVHPDFQGSQVKSQSYLYDLFLDGNSAITGGVWKAASVYDHPDVLSIPLSVDPKSEDLDYQEVVRLSQASDDYLENGSNPVSLPPGTYNLILLDQDRYQIDCRSGDTIALTVEKQEGSTEELNISLFDAQGFDIAHAVTTETEPAAIFLTAVNPPYYLVLTQADYSDPNIYTVKLDLGKAHARTVPFIPSNNSMWCGFAITNLYNTPATRVMLTSYSADGTPVQTLFGPLTMQAGEKQIFLFSNLPWRTHERSSHNKVSVMSDTPVSVVNLFGPASLVSVSGFCPEEATQSSFIIPDTQEPMAIGKVMFGGVENRSFDPVAVIFRVYSKEGVIKKDFLKTIQPRATFAINPDSSPFSPMPSSGWIEVSSDPNLNSEIIGYQQISAGAKAESLFGLRTGSARTFVPHVPPPGEWVTKLTIINPHDEVNEVTLHLSRAGANRNGDQTIILAPREKRVIELQDDFGMTPASPYYHSILEVTGQDTIAGYFTYSSTADEASLPLMDASNLKTQISMPHSPGTSDIWWVGIGVANPSSSMVTVQARPYDTQGALMSDSIQTFSLLPNAYEVFTLANLFGPVAASQVSFVTFSTVDGQSLIGGFYLYGTSGNVMLSGAVMQ